MKVQLKAIKVMKTSNGMGIGEAHTVIRCSRVVDDIDAFTVASQEYFRTIFPDCIVILDTKNVK